MLSDAALYAAVVVLPPPPLLLPPLLGVEPPLLDDVLLLQPPITMAAATAMPIAADTFRCRFISCNSSPVVWFLAELNGDGHPGGLPDCSRGWRRGEVSGRVGPDRRAPRGDLGSRASRNPSPKRLNAMTAMKIVTPGATR